MTLTSSKAYSFFISVKDIVTYTAVITGIPAGKYDTPIDVQGTVKNLENGTVTDSGEAVSKSVTGVVQEIKKAYPELGQTQTGKFYLPEKEVDVVNEYDDNKFAWGSPGGALRPIESANVVVGDDKITIDAPLAYSAGGTQPGEYCVLAEVKGTEGKTITIGHMNKGQNIGGITANGQKQTVEGYITFDGDGTAYPAFALASEGTFELYSLKMVKILDDSDMKATRVDLTRTPAVEEGVTVVNNPDGTLTINWAADAPNYKGVDFYFSAPQNLSNCSELVIKGKGSIDCVSILDNAKKSQYGGAAGVGLKYGINIPSTHNLQGMLVPDYNGNLAGGDDADYTNVKGVHFQKGTQTEACSITISAIYFK